MQFIVLHQIIFIQVLMQDFTNAQVEFKIGGLIRDVKLTAQHTHSNDDEQPLSYDEYEKELSSGIMPTIHFASKKIVHFFQKNYNCNVKLELKDTQCDVAYTTNSFFNFANDAKDTLLLFGGGSCDSTLYPIAESVQFFNMSILSFSETDPRFYDSSKYNGFYRLVPSDDQHNHLRIKLVQKYNWKRIGTIYSTKAKYTLVHNEFIRELENRILINGTLMTRSLIENANSTQYEAILNEFIQNDIKIIFIMANLNTTLKLFCNIYKLKLYGENYQWFIHGSYKDNLILLSETNCTSNELLTALNGTLQTRVVEYSHKYEAQLKQHQNETLNLNENDLIDYLRDIYLFQFYKNCLNSKVNNDDPCPFSYFHGYAYDSLLSIFKLLSLLIKNNKFQCNNTKFERNIDWFRLINTHFNSLKFKGVTGQVSFSNGGRIGEIKMEQIRVSYNGKDNLEIVPITIYDQNKQDFIKVNKVLWHNNNPPSDSTMKLKYLYKINTNIFICMSTFATLGVLLALAFLIFNVKYRNHRFIKMSSPNLNNLIIAGCLLAYINIYFLGLSEGMVPPKALTYICRLRVWLITVGFTFAFGSMFSKTYRVHAILTNTKIKKKAIKDYRLFVIVLLLLIFDIIIILFWELLDPLKVYRRLYDFVSIDRNFIMEEIVCESKNAAIWIGLLFCYKGLLIVFGSFFAYETRHVTMPALNDSKYIGISVYNVLIMCCIGSVIAFVLQNRSVAFVLISLFTFTCTTITLCLVFIPKIIEVRKDPLGLKKQKTKAQFKNRTRPGAITICDNSDNEMLNKNKTCLLLDQIAEKKEHLSKINLELENLQKKFGTLAAYLTTDAQQQQQNQHRLSTTNSLSMMESYYESKKTSLCDDDLARHCL